MRLSPLPTATAFIIFLTAPALVSAQTRPGDAPPRPADSPTPRAESSNADEDYELNIDQRRIREGDFSAETAVSTGGERGLQVNVGVALRASEIDVLLRNVRVRVRFRASLDDVLRRLGLQRRPGAPANPSPP